MNVNAKIVSKVLAMRVKKIIYKLVYIDQTAYIKGRFIDESVRLIKDLHNSKYRTRKIYNSKYRTNLKEQSSVSSYPTGVVFLAS